MRGPLGAALNRLGSVWGGLAQLPGNGSSGTFWLSLDVRRRNFFAAEFGATADVKIRPILLGALPSVKIYLIVLKARQGNYY